MVPDGTRFADVVESCKAEEPSAVGIWPYLEHPEGVSAVPEAAAVEIFFMTESRPPLTVAPRC